MSLKSVLCLLMFALFVLPSAADNVDDAIIHLRDPDPNIRGNAASWFVGNGNPRAVDPLIEALKDEDVMVRKYAAMSLGAIGDRRAVDPLIEALKDESGGVRSSASEALGAIGDPRAVDPLIEVLEDEDEAKTGVAWTAARALGEIIGATGQWESFTPDQTAFAAQPGSVFPLRYSPVEAGSYLFMIGPAGDDGLDLPPESWKAVGPYELVGGHKIQVNDLSWYR
ncbi:MAG: HEAT repeat domain-containing protein [Methanothrix sp.]|nr:MAG: HEAT repeat domain-containing protein [Methanothrix sp.]